MSSRVFTPGTDPRPASASCRACTANDALFEYIVRLAEESRQHPDVALGASPRAALNLLRCARARAVLEGRHFFTHEDVQAIAFRVLGHRLILRPEAEIEGKARRRRGPRHPPRRPASWRRSNQRPNDDMLTVRGGWLLVVTVLVLVIGAFVVPFILRRAGPDRRHAPGLVRL